MSVMLPGSNTLSKPNGLYRSSRTQLLRYMDQLKSKFV